MSQQLESLLAALLEELSKTGPDSDRIADILSDHAIYIEELEEEERRLVDRFLEDAFALRGARERS
jgi:hypothetical protein